LKQFRQYLLRRHFTLRTVHSALSYLKTTLEPVGQCARLIDLFEQYDSEIIHRNERSHANADALSRRPCRLDCRQCGRHQIAVNAVTTRRQAVCEESGPGSSPIRPTWIKMVRVTATASQARRRRRGNLVPAGERTSEYLATQQQAGHDIGQVYQWKSGTPDLVYYEGL